MRWDGIAGRLCGLAALLGAWEAVSRRGHGIAVASPEETFAAMAGLLAQPAFWAGDLVVSVRRVGLGFLLGFLVGGGLGLAAGFWPPIRAFLVPSRWMLTSVPGVVAVMLGMLWFGLGSTMVVAIVALMVAPAMHVAVIEGLSSVDGSLLEMARAYRFTPAMRLWHVYAPAMAAPLFSGGVVALGGAMRVAVLAEALGSNEGIGHALAVARTNLDTPRLYALALCSMLLVGLAEMTLLGLARRVVGRRRS
ncbi:MAG TPA: ABC transporter permease subunit [Solidesulfovibrio magneticus]|jgi:NitT/TauT family transport system permease protein|nr:ABC transporter permease subunit [Solidesulfovibrio magneticus]